MTLQHQKPNEIPSELDQPIKKLPNTNGTDKGTRYFVIAGRIWDLERHQRRHGTSHKYTRGRNVGRYQSRVEWLL